MTGQTVGGFLSFARENEVDKKPAPYDNPSSDGETGDERSIVVIELRERSRTCKAGRRSNAGGTVVNALCLYFQHGPNKAWCGLTKDRYCPT